MEYNLDTPISAFAIHPLEPGKVFLGFLDGNLSCRHFDFNNQQQSQQNGSSKFKAKSKKDNNKSGNELWRNKLKRAIRSAQFSPDGTSIYVTSSNRALCMFDTETGKRLRCIRECHKSRPNAICLLPAKINGQQFATGAENGEIKTWDFRQSKPQCARFADQEDIINSFHVWKNGTLLAASSDGTLAAYDLHKAKMRVQSEAMHSELLSLAVTNRFTYAGSADGHIEVFKSGEFGNILERIETPMLMGVEQLAVLRDNLLLATASTQGEIRFVHVNPNKCLGGIPFPGGVDLASKTPNATHFLVTSGDGTKLAAFPLAEIVRDVPELKAQDMGQFKRMEKERRRKLGGGEDGEKGKAREFYKDMLEEDEEKMDDEDEEEDSEINEEDIEMDSDEDEEVEDEDEN